MEVNNTVETNQSRNLTIVEKLKYFFTNPNKIFEDYNTKPTWFVKFLVIVALSVFVTLITKDFIMGAQIDILLEQTPDMTREQAMAAMNSPIVLVVSIIGAVASGAAVVFLVPLIYWGLLSAFGGKTNYMKVVAVYTLAYIPYYVGSMLSLFYSYFTNNFDSLLKPELTDVLFQRFDIFVIWQVLLLVFGFSKIANMKLSKSAIMVGIMWLIVTGISAAQVLLR